MHDVKLNQNKMVIYSKENMRLQRSKYISVGNIQNDTDQILDAKYIEPLDLKYCLPQEINKKMQKFLLFKGQFLAKLIHMKNFGQRCILMMRISKWIEDNIDELVKD